MTRITWTSALSAILITSGFFWLLPACEAQNRMAPPEYDYYSLAITSVLNSAAEASKLSDVPQRVKVLISAAKILPASQHDEAVRLLDVALRDLKQWGSEDRAGWYQRHTAVELRNEVLALYARVDPEKTAALQKEFQPEAKSTTANSSVTSLKSEYWSTQFRDQSAIADQPAKIALSLVDTDPEKALGLVVQSLQGGIVSGVLFEIVQKLIQDGNRAFLNKLEIGVGQVLAGNVTLDPFSLSNAAILVLADKDMSSAARSSFAGFFMRSLQAWAIVVEEPGIDTSYISRVFFVFSQIVRLVISQYSPDQMIAFNLVLDQVAPLVPEKTKSSLEAFQPETFSEPKERLNDILRDPKP